MEKTTFSEMFPDEKPESIREILNQDDFEKIGMIVTESFGDYSKRDRRRVLENASVALGMMRTNSFPLSFSPDVEDQVLSLILTVIKRMIDNEEPIKF